MLGPLVNQSELTLFMSTIGATFIIEGAAQMLFGSDVYPLQLYPTDVWIVLEEVFPGGLLISKLDVWGGVIAGVLVAGLAVFFQWTKTGRPSCVMTTMRPRSQSVFNQLTWFVVWLAAGLCAIAATVWGARRSVLDHYLPQALPVLIIGALSFRRHRRALIGAGEKLAEIYLGPLIGGGIEYWFAYVLALLVLLVRPQGLFGERIIERI